MKLLFFDLETTGTNPGRNGIHQISGQVVIDGIVKESFDFHVQPNPKAAIEDEALAVAGVTREQIAQYPAMGTVYRQFVAMLGKYVDKYNSKDKFFLVGYNNAKICPFIKPKEQESAPGDEILDFSKGESMFNETAVFNQIEQAPEIEHGHEEKPTPEELKAAEKRMYDTIFEKEIVNNINGLSPMMTEKQFKESVRHDTDWMMKTFTFNENMMIAFVPLVISHLAWVYAEKVMKYCAEHKIPETVKLSRAVKHVRQEYVDSLKNDLDARHIQHIEKQTEEFFKEYTSDFTIFWYCVNSQYKKQFPGDIYKDMKTDAFLGVLMCRFLVDHNKRMDKIIEAKMGFAQSIKNLYMDKLETCLDAYCGNQVIECDTNIKACLKVLEKNINEIDFEITG